MKETRENVIQKVYKNVLVCRCRSSGAHFFVAVGSSGNISMSKLFHSHLSILHYRVHNERNFFIVLAFKGVAFSPSNEMTGVV